MYLRPFVRSTALLATLVGLAIAVALVAAPSPPSHEAGKPGFTADGELMRPTGYREWTYVGTPLTPNELNGGEAPFPRVSQRLHPPG
jgi:hypothetical protein